jgi:hypothetical protein
VTKLFYKILSLGKPVESERKRRVLVGGKIVKMTSLQARRYEELRREEQPVGWRR